jgi:starch synthase
MARALGWNPDILHANDWHTAPAVYALSLSRDPFYKNTASLLGVHNLPYLGVSAGPALQDFGLPPARGSALPGWAQDLPLPLGLLAADWIVAVSPTYAREILTSEFGSGLEGFLRTRAGSISGILNGLI